MIIKAHDAPPNDLPVHSPRGLSPCRGLSCTLVATSYKNLDDPMFKSMAKDTPPCWPGWQWSAQSQVACSTGTQLYAATYF